MKNLVVLVSGASSGFGALTVRVLAEAGHVVYAGMRDTKGRNAKKLQDAEEFAHEKNVALRTVELDVVSDASVRAGVAQVLSEAGHIDVVVHNAGHMAYGPAEAFSVEQMAELYDINVLSTQRINKAVLPHMRTRKSGLLVWVSSSSARGGTPPFIAPYFAAKSAMDNLAVSYHGELTQWGIETTIVVPGAFSHGTNHFTNAGAPADHGVAQEYADGPYKGVAEKVTAGFMALEPPTSDVHEVARQIARVIALPRGQRPLRVHIDPAEDGSELVNAVADRMRLEVFRRAGVEYLLNLPQEQ